MTESYELQPIQVIGPVGEWARAHPSFFFPGGIVSAESMVEQLLAGAQALGSNDVEAYVAGEWFVVASHTDWFARARFPVPETLERLTPFPELAVNSVRPECVAAAFADAVVVRSPAGTRVATGEVGEDDAIIIHLAQGPAWQRAVAFRGLRTGDQGFDRLSPNGGVHADGTLATRM